MGNVVRMNVDEDLSARIERAKAIESAIERKETFPYNDQLQAARNLHRILEKARTVKAFNVNNVLAAKCVGLAGNGTTDSTKRLDTYTLPDGASDRRKKRIAKKPAKFLDLAKAVAMELNKPAAVVVCQVFEGCSYGTEELPSQDWESENWSRFAENLQLMAAAVIRDCGVEDYWKKVFGTNGLYDVRTEAFRPSSNALGYILFGWGLAGEWMVSDETSPTPSIALGRRLQHNPIPGLLTLEEDGPREVYFLLWLEVRLAIGPVNDTKSIGPLLEFRTILEAATVDGHIVRFDNPFHATDEWINRAFIDGDEFTVQDFGFTIDMETQNRNFRPIVEPEFRSGAEHSYFGWREVSPALLRSLFDPAATDRKASFVPVNRHKDDWENEFPPNRFSRATAAGVINIDLLNGSLEAELGAECQRLAAGLDEYRFEQDRAIRDKEAEAMARWSTRNVVSSTVRKPG